eukprot:GHVR01089166.1.p1 GENE.GHVR01089166.1~~GHVR01089166.1.p1  ORF type:complete len:133 (-),score=7.68 GHVR01089166.1:2331-2729(-)
MKQFTERTKTIIKFSIGLLVFWIVFTRNPHRFYAEYNGTLTPIDMHQQQMPANNISPHGSVVAPYQYPQQQYLYNNNNQHIQNQNQPLGGHHQYGQNRSQPYYQLQSEENRHIGGMNNSGYAQSRYGPNQSE